MLTAKKVDSKLAPGRYPDGHGLFLHVGKDDFKSWFLRYSFHGVEKRMVLGPLRFVSLSEARRKADDQPSFR